MDTLFQTVLLVPLLFLIGSVTVVLHVEEVAKLNNVARKEALAKPLAEEEETKLSAFFFFFQFYFIFHFDIKKIENVTRQVPSQIGPKNKKNQ